MTGPPTPSQEKDFITLLAGRLLSSGSVLGLSRRGEPGSHSTTELALWLAGSSTIPVLTLIFSRLELCLGLCSLTETARDGCWLKTVSDLKPPGWSDE